MCFPFVWFLLTWDKSGTLWCHFLHPTQCNAWKHGMARPRRSSLCCQLPCNGLSIFLLTTSKIPFRILSPSLYILPNIIPQEFPCPFTWAEVTNLYEHSPRYKIMWKLMSDKGNNWGITKIAWALLSNARALIQQLWDPPSVLQQQWTYMRANEEMVEMIQTSQIAGEEPVNGEILNCREMARFSDPHIQISKGTVTQIHIKTSSQAWTTVQMPQYL